MRRHGELGGAEAVRRQHDEGRLTVRERIDAVVDGGTFQEVGSLAGVGRDEDGVRKLAGALRDGAGEGRRA